MDRLKDTLAVNVHSTSELSREIGDLRKESVSAEKLNVVRIKIGGLNEDIKRLNSVYSEFRADSGGKLDMIDRTLKNLGETAARKINVNDSIEELKKSIESVRRSNTNLVSKSGMERLVREINSEFENTRKEMDIVSLNGGRVVEKKMLEARKEFRKFREDTGNEILLLKNEHAKNAKDLEKKAGQLKIEFDAAKKELEKRTEKYRKELSAFVKRKQIEGLVEDVNGEFNELRKDIDRLSSSIDINSQELNSVKSRFIRRSEAKESFNELNDSIRKMLSAVNEIKKKVRLTDDSEERMDYLRRELRNLEKKTGKALKAKRPGILRFANVLVVLSFISLGGSFLTYFLYYGGWTNLLLVIAIVLFAAGVALRIAGMLRR